VYLSDRDVIVDYAFAKQPWSRAVLGADRRRALFSIATRVRVPAAR
jgi:hypothetical protein